MGLTVIVNAPVVFRGVWATVKPWIDEKTRAKIKIRGSNYQKYLLDLVDEDQLIDFLGGKNCVPLHENHGVWKEYEVVDGNKAGDVVGVRKISDGPTGSVFTIQDMV